MEIRTNSFVRLCHVTPRLDDSYSTKENKGDACYVLYDERERVYFRRLNKKYIQLCKVYRSDINQYNV